MITKDRQKAYFISKTSGLYGYLEVLSFSATTTVEPGSIWSLDALIYPIRQSEHPLGEHNVSLVFPEDTNASLPILLESKLALLKLDSSQAPIPLRFLFSSTAGYLIRSDFLQQRLECSQFISAVTSFLEPLQKVHGVSIDGDVSDIASLLSKAIGSLSLHHDTSTQDLDTDLSNRLSFPWLSKTPLSPRRLAWVQGREDIDCIDRVLKAASALGIKLVVLDEPGHWLQDPKSPWAHLREAFVEVDIIADEGLATRVVDAIRAYPEAIDGVVTISDVRLPAIARACIELGLPTESPEAYDIASDKGQTRMLEAVGADESFVLSKADELEPYLESRADPLHFPLVVKPVVGWCSDCVSKVRNLGELTVAVRKASERHADSAKPSTTVVVEPYIDGPEVDANFALMDGEILFFDINDDFPSPADEEGAGFHANFQETQNVIPSGLPQIELDAIRDQMRDSILRQGFRSGVFHCEARVRNSGVKFASKNGSIVDLVARDGLNDNSRLEIYLHENNARPPGYLESVAILLTYGVDYYALRMLLALGPSESSRLRALSQPFLKGPQFHLSLMIIQQNRAGIMKTPDAAQAFLEQHANMKQHVVDFYTRKKGGDVLEGPDASALWWIAYFSVTSRHSRRELLERVDFIQRNFTYEVEE